MPRVTSSIAALVIMAVLCALVRAQADGDNAALPQPSPEQIAQWINDLDSNVFDERETATENLIRAGEPVVAPLSEVLPGGSLELATRGVYVLRQLAVSGDSGVEDAARLALEKIARARLSAAARRAATTLATLDELREKRAIAELRRLGARVNANATAFGFALPENLLEIEIDENWRGKPSDLRNLKWIQQAQQITVSGDQVTDAWVGHIAEMPNVVSVAIKRASITDNGLAPLNKLNRLQVLDLRYVRVGDDAVEHLRNLRSLAMVKVYGTDITPQAAQKLEDLLPGDDNVDHKAGAFLGVQIQQHQLHCTVDIVVADSAAAQAELQKGDIIVKCGEARVTGFPDLQKVLSRKRAGDPLRFEVMRGAQILPAAIAHREGDVLGIEGKPHSMGVLADKVLDESVASRIQLKAGDIVTRYQDQPVFEPKALADLFAANKPGEQYSLEFTRGGQLLVLRTELGEWP